MHQHRVNMRTLSLLAVGSICCLLSGSAHAQRAVSKRAASTSTTGSTTSGSTTSGTCMSGSSSTSSSSGTTTGTTSGVISPTKTTSATLTTTTATNTTATNTALAASAVSAVRTSANQLSVQYTGSTSGVKAVYIATLDTNEKALQQQAITQSPVRTTLSLASTARYYGVQVVYTNGSTKTLIATIK